MNFDTVVSEIDSNGLKACVILIRSWGWVLQLYVQMTTIEVLSEIIPSLGIPLIFDHFVFLPLTISPFSPPPGFTTLMRILLDPTSQLYIEISAPYRVDASLPSLHALFETYFCVAPERLVFATDWRHTMFDGYGMTEWVQTVVEWCMEIGGQDAVTSCARAMPRCCGGEREEAVVV